MTLRPLLLGAVLLALTLPALAQDAGTPTDAASDTPSDTPAITTTGTATGAGAVLRVLDKINGEVMDLTLPNGTGGVAWRIEVELGECRYPAGNPAGDAFAFVTLRQTSAADPLFRGWMIASAPALNALDHPRYDVWVIRCTTA
jgi:hypothetical protein